MKNFAIIGLGRFTQCIVDVLCERRREVFVIDKSEEKLQVVRDKVTKAVKADVVNFELLKEVLPDRIECAIIDLGDVIGPSILVANYLHKLGIKEIVVEAVDAEHAEILKIVGATRVVFPEREAAERLGGMLVGGGILDFFAVSEGFSMIEIPVPKKWIGRTPAALAVRQSEQVEVIAVRRSAITPSEDNWTLVDGQRPFALDDIVLVAGAARNVERLAG